MKIGICLELCHETLLCSHWESSHHSYEEDVPSRVFDCSLLSSCDHQYIGNTTYPPSPMQAPESASRTPSSAGHALLVQGREDSATEGVHITTALELDVCLESAPPLPIEKTLAPPVHNLLSRLRRRSAVDSVKTSPPVLELLHASIVLWTPLMNLVSY